MIKEKFYISLTITIFCTFISYADEINKIVTNVEPPTNYYSKNGELIGPSTEIVKEIIKILNIDVDIEVLPWARAYYYVKNYPNVAIFTAGKSQERIDHGFNFIGPIFTRNHVLLNKKGNPCSITSLQDIKKNNLVIGVVRDDWRAKILKDKGISIEEVTEHKQNFLKLIAGRIDLWCSSDIDASFIAKNNGFNIEDIEIAYFLTEGSGYIMFSKDTSKEILENWQNAFLLIQKTDFFEKTSKKWSNLLDVNLRYKANKGFYINSN